MGIFDRIASSMGGMQGEVGKPQDANDQLQDDKDLCGWVKSRVEEYRAQGNRVAHEGVWMTNIAYLLGFDSVYYNANQRQWVPVNNGSSRGLSRNRLRENLILPACQNRLARLLKSPPKYEVLPNSEETEDKDAAELGLQIINDFWDREKINLKRLSLGMWTMECGHAYGKVYWDPSGGESLGYDDNGEFLGWEGCKRFDVVSALEIFPDPLAKTLDECNSLIQAKVRKLDYFRNKYDLGHLVKEEGPWLLSSQYEMRINTMNTAGYMSSGQIDQMKNAAIEVAYYEKKSKAYPRGRLIITANGVLLHNDKLPFGEIPFSKFDDVVVGGKYYSESLITHARPLQDQYNITLNKRARWVSQCLNGKFIAAKGHGLMEEALNDQSGEVVEYDPVPNASEPKDMRVPVMPDYAYKETDDIKSSLYGIFGLSEISRGQLPSASIPAQGMNILLEQDETRIGIETEQHEHAWARIGMLALKCDAEFAKTKRSLKKMVGNEYKITKYNGQSLKRNFDVKVRRGSTVPNSKVLERQDTLNLYTQGLMGNPQDPGVRERVLGAMEFGDTTFAFKQFKLTMAQISRDLEQIRQGGIPPVDELDDHILHASEKNMYRISDKFFKLTPEQQQVLRDNIDIHVQMQTNLMNPAQPPDGGQHPQEALAQLAQQAPGLDQLPEEVQTNNIAV